MMSTPACLRAQGSPPAATFNAQLPNTVLAGPASGSASSSPVARSIVTADLPAFLNGLDAAVPVSGPVNVLQYACGIPIGDGNVHTVGNAPAGSCFAGKTTLAGLASIAINGQTPFWFLTDGGAQTGPACTAGSSVNCFTAAGGAYQLTDAQAPALDIAWLSLEAALLTGKAYLPSGTYIVGHSLALPLMIPMNMEGTGYPSRPLRVQGDGESNSIVEAGSDFGAGSALLSCGDPSGSAANSLGRYNGNSGQCSGDVQDIGLWSGNASVYFAKGTVPIQMDGFLWGARLRTKDVIAAGFNHDWNLVGDHTLFIRPIATGGAYGFYYGPPNAVLVGDLQFMSAGISGASIAGVLFDGAASDSGTWAGETYIGGAPYAFLGASNGCSAMLAGSTFQHLMTEYIGNAFISDDHNYSAGTYNDQSKCRSVQKTTIGYWFGSFYNANFLGGGRARRASIDVNQLGLTVGAIETDGGSLTPNAIAAPSGAAPVAVFNVNGAGDYFGGVSLSGNINGLISLSGALPLFNRVAGIGAVELHQRGGWSGGMTPLYASGNVTTTTAGDCLEGEQYGAVYCGTNYDGSSPALVGVVMQGGLPIGGAPVPYASSGVVPTNLLWNSGSWGPEKRAAGIRGLALTGGSGYTNGTYALQFSSGCWSAPVGTVTVSGGALSSYTLTATGTCSALPTVNLPVAAGPGRGGAITALWPSGAFATSTGYTDLPRIGNNVGSGSGSNANGTLVQNVLLQGLD
ncbi:MAG TPA: hypothetical protein VGD62_05805 [Acidobacteriaceae bacterium]